jgi:hypothetical protein
MKRDCKAFIKEAKKFLFSDNYVGESQYYGFSAVAGHDFWLTRNRHGAGFWDGHWRDSAELTQIAHSYGEQHIEAYRKRLHVM